MPSGGTVAFFARAFDALAVAARVFFRAVAFAFFSRAALASAFAAFFGQFMFTQRTHGGRLRMMTLMIGFPHASHRSSVVSMSPRCGSGWVLSQSG